MPSRPSTVWPRGRTGRPRPHPSASRDAAPPFPRSLAGWLLPLAVAAHAWLALSDIARPEGLDLSIANALSVVAWLTAILAWGSGLLRTLPAVGTVVLPVTAIASLLPALVVNPHRFPYAGDALRHRPRRRRAGRLRDVHHRRGRRR